MGQQEHWFAFVLWDVSHSVQLLISMTGLVCGKSWAPCSSCPRPCLLHLPVITSTGQQWHTGRGCRGSHRLTCSQPGWARPAVLSSGSFLTALRSQGPGGNTKCIFLQHGGGSAVPLFLGSYPASAGAQGYLHLFLGLILVPACLVRLRMAGLLSSKSTKYQSPCLTWSSYLVVHKSVHWKLRTCLGALLKSSL